MDPLNPAVAEGTLLRPFKQRGLTMQQVRQDRIRDEASETADPVHLMRLFGITSGTAMKYVTAAHPERTTKLPR